MGYTLYIDTERKDLPPAGDPRAKLALYKQGGQASAKRVKKASPVDVFLGKTLLLEQKTGFPLSNKQKAGMAGT